MALLARANLAGVTHYIYRYIRYGCSFGCLCTSIHTVVFTHSLCAPSHTDSAAQPSRIRNPQLHTQPRTHNTHSLATTSSAFARLKTKQYYNYRRCWALALAALRSRLLLTADVLVCGSRTPAFRARDSSNSLTTTSYRPAFRSRTLLTAVGVLVRAFRPRDCR